METTPTQLQRNGLAEYLIVMGETEFDRDFTPVERAHITRLVEENQSKSENAITEEDQE